MPWDILARLRRPVRRQPAPEPPSQDIAPQHPQEPSALQLPIDRKILQDPSSLLESEAQPTLPHSLTPSVRLPSADSSRYARSRPRPPNLSLGTRPQRSELPARPSVENSPRTPSKFAISRIPKIAAGGEWSTFGRKRQHRDAGVGGVSEPSPDSLESTSHSPSPMGGGQHLGNDSTPSVFTPSRITNPSVPHGGQSSAGTRSPRQSPDIHFGSRRSSPTDTMSSKWHPRTPQGPSSRTTPVAALGTSSVSNLTIPINREIAIDSPHTFGHPTPPDKSVEFFASSPPPLPPLDHPALAAALASRRQSTSATLRDRSNTLPTNRRSPRKEDLFPSLSLRLAGSVPHRSSISQAMAGPSETRSPDRQSRRARTVSAGTRRRRTSADWSSYQASVGVTSPANQAWPAEVSREILRLSLRPAAAEDAPGSPERRKVSTRGRNPDPVRRSNRGAVSPSFLPFPHPHPSPPVTPPPSSTASATLPDGRYKSHSLPFDPGNRTSNQSKRPQKTTMAEVKRSLSAVESRNGRHNGHGGVSYPSLGLGDPAQPKTSPAAPLLDSSFALTPSRSLLSGRVSSTNTPMPSSGEPSTPTPAPRQLSEKSRGKRKAEDNIDLTPPEQKKEGQRATFLLPSEPRSQRVSGSSHAPSSYHRKRARLSSTSPFATPVQSRPSSMHETPRSANRSHHFASLSSSTGGRIAPSRTPSGAASTRSRQPPATPSTNRKHERHQSMSQISIPISAIVSPHAPSVSRSTKFHMRDPRKPPRKPNDTPWGLRFATEDEPASPIHAWCFFIGFLLFPVWWIAGLFLRIPRTRIAGDVDAEKGVTIDDPQIEHDARTWRFRCRVMAALSLFTYIPFIVLVAVFAPR